MGSSLSPNILIYRIVIPLAWRVGYSSVHLVNKHILNTYYVPGSIKELRM